MRKPLAPLPQRQLVTFRLGETEFGLDVGVVHEVLRHEPVTPLPKAPAFVEGVLDVRGTLVPIVDLRRRFEAAPAAAAADTRVLVIDHLGTRLGLVVDHVTEVLRVPEEAVSEPPPYVRGQTAECVHAIVRLPERLVLLLDVERLLGSDERLALTELEAAIARMLAEEAEAARDAEPEARPGAEEAEAEGDGA